MYDMITDSTTTATQTIAYIGISIEKLYDIQTQETQMMTTTLNTTTSKQDTIKVVERMLLSFYNYCTGFIGMIPSGGVGMMVLANDNSYIPFKVDPEVILRLFYPTRYNLLVVV